MSPKDREPFLEALDELLLPLGFKRRKAFFEWKRRVDDGNLEWIHLNFGLGVINPSLGVRYEDLSATLPRDAGAQVSVAEMLSSLSGKAYSIDTSPLALSADVESMALPGLKRLGDRAWVVERLKLDSPREWPTFGASSRMRLLPLMLAQSGQINQALEWLSHFESTASGVDQHVPNFAAYATYFRAQYSA